MLAFRQVTLHATLHQEQRSLIQLVISGRSVNFLESHGQSFIITINLKWGSYI